MVRWDTARLNLTAGVFVTERDKTEICSTNSNRKTYKAFKSKNTFTEMTKLCRILGGRTAVAEDAGALRLMEEY